MTLLLGHTEITERARLASSVLHPLAESLAAELEPVAERLPEMPAEKALLSRNGGRCAVDGTMLAFDPWSPDRHRCGACGRVFEGERHDRWWVTWQQLWLAERAVIGASLHRVTGSIEGKTVARHVLEQASERYLELPNVDNVLGPSRPFFSTYLESIWLLQLCVAADLLALDSGDPLLSRFSERVVEPSAALIASYDEGRSNRQVWNAAAVMAAGVLLERDAFVDAAVWSRSGLFALLDDALLPDGTWYEGENYHLFAHRGLWYGVALCEAQSIAIPTPLGDRFQEGFATPLLTALPDLSVPSRRDSQYGVSLRQWRCAESFELGLARRHDARLAGALRTLYATDGERGDTGRWCSTAEAERNVPPSRLTRADLGWKSLLFACPELPPATEGRASSVLLESQGFAVLRPKRDVYVSLDYGESGGGHGHPDRLGLMFVVGTARWLDDPGTGSYVDPSLFWYRSTLAHNAPLVDGMSQRPARGRLLAFDVGVDAAWVSAGLPAHATAGVHFRRTLVVLPEYVVDLIEWSDASGHVVDLPYHVPYDAASTLPWAPRELPSSPDREDGFTFLRDVEGADVREPHVALSFDGAHAMLHAALQQRSDSLWWRARHPGPPDRSEGAVFTLRTGSSSGALLSAWSWDGPLRLDASGDEEFRVGLASGVRDHHRRTTDGWEIERSGRDVPRRIVLAGRRAEASAREPGLAPELPATEARDLAPGHPFTRELGERAYRRSESSWRDAGEPRAVVTLVVEDGELLIHVSVMKQPVILRAEGDDPELDNEHPDIHSDGVQLHLLPEGAVNPVNWLLIPQHGTAAVRMHRSGGDAAPEPRATWRFEPDGYALWIRLPLPPLLTRPNGTFALDVIVNEIGEGRQRRRGQLVLSGGEGEYIYLRGDRQPADRYLRFRIAGV